MVVGLHNREGTLRSILALRGPRFRAAQAFPVDGILRRMELRHNQYFERCRYGEVRGVDDSGVGPSLAAGRSGGKKAPVISCAGYWSILPRMGAGVLWCLQPTPEVGWHCP